MIWIYDGISQYNTILNFDFFNFNVLGNGPLNGIHCNIKNMV